MPGSRMSAGEAAWLGRVGRPRRRQCRQCPGRFVQPCCRRAWYGSKSVSTAASLGRETMFTDRQTMLILQMRAVGGSRFPGRRTAASVGLGTLVVIIGSRGWICRRPGSSGTAAAERSAGQAQGKQQERRAHGTSSLPLDGLLQGAPLPVCARSCRRGFHSKKLCQQSLSGPISKEVHQGWASSHRRALSRSASSRLPTRARHR